MELSVSTFFKSMDVNLYISSIGSSNEVILTLRERETGLPRFVRLTFKEAKQLADEINRKIEEQEK